MLQQISFASRIRSRRTFVCLPQSVNFRQFDVKKKSLEQATVRRSFSITNTYKSSSHEGRDKFHFIMLQKRSNGNGRFRYSHSLTGGIFENDGPTEVQQVDEGTTTTIENEKEGHASNNSDATSQKSYSKKIQSSKIDNTKKTIKKKSVPDQIKSRRRKKTRAKAKKIRKLVKIGVEPSVPLQINRNAEFLFDTLAPRMEMKAIETLIDIMNSFGTPGQYTALSQNISNKSDDNSKGEPNISPQERLKVFLTSNEIIEENHWLSPLLSHFLMGKLFENPDRSENENASYNKDFPTHPHLLASEYSEEEINHIFEMVANDATFTANINRQNLERNIQILMDARNKAAEKPLKWASKKGGKQKKRHRNDNQATVELPSNYHCLKTDDSLYDEAQEMALFLADRLPDSSHRKLYEMLYSYSHEGKSLFQSNEVENINADGSETDTSNGKNKEKKKKLRKQSLKNVFPCVKQKVNAHTPFIIRELADFLYVDVPTDTNKKYSNITPHHPQFSTHDVADDQLHRAWQRWYRMREKHVKAAILAQHQFAFFDEAEEKNEMGKKNLDDDMESANAESTTKVQNRRTKGAYVVFDAMKLEETPADINEPHLVNSSQDKSYIEPERTIFLNNLPIDITEEEIKDCYERCGPISSLKIYNLRPDLDPGKLTTTELKKIRKKQRLNMKTVSKCTPVYAIVQFSNEKGFLTASNTHLTIFGMVIRRHAVKSIPATQISDVFIENIPSGYYSLDLEYKLNKALQPHVYICLDSVNGVRGRESYDYTESKSCKIKFPSFETAFFAYQRLQMIDILHGDESSEEDEAEARCQLQWMRTPANAMKFWKREIAYDF